MSTQTEKKPGGKGLPKPAKKAKAPVDPNAPPKEPRVFAPVHLRNFLARERVEPVLQSFGVDLTEFYDRLASSRSSRGTVGESLMAAYRAFLEDGSESRFIAAAGIKKAQINATIGRCAKQAILNRVRAAPTAVAQVHAQEAELEPEASYDPADPDLGDPSILTAN